MFCYNFECSRKRKISDCLLVQRWNTLLVYFDFYGNTNWPESDISSFCFVKLFDFIELQLDTFVGNMKNADCPHANPEFHFKWSGNIMLGIENVNFINTWTKKKINHTSGLHESIEFCRKICGAYTRSQQSIRCKQFLLFTFRRNFLNFWQVIF